MTRLSGYCLVSGLPLAALASGTQRTALFDLLWTYLNRIRSPQIVFEGDWSTLGEGSRQKGPVTSGERLALMVRPSLVETKVCASFPAGLFVAVRSSLQGYGAKTPVQNSLFVPGI